MNPDTFYPACNLNGNPFRIHPNNDDDPRAKIWVGYENQKKQLQKIVDRVRADKVGLTNFVLLYGAYGAGKSHALLWIRSWVKSDNAGVAYFMPTLKKEKGKLSFSAALAEDLIERGSLVLDLENFKNFFETRILEVKNGLGIHSNEEAIEHLIKSHELAEFVKQLCTCQTETQIKNLLNAKNLSDYQAVMLFSKIVNLFVQSFKTPVTDSRFKQAIYLLIDELDDLQRQPPKETLETNDMLRHLYDACPNSFGLIGALSAELTTLSNSFTDYVLSRVTRQIQFDLLDRENAIQFIRDILDAQPNRFEYNPAKSGFYPFHEEAVDTIVSQLRTITPRKIVNVMQNVIEELRLEGYDPNNGLVSNQTLDELDILDTVFGDGAVI